MICSTVPVQARVPACSKRTSATARRVEQLVSTVSMRTGPGTSGAW
jgi:hypothetical protein